MKIDQVFKNYNKDSLIKPYIIAEAGVNHEGSMETAKRLIEEAKQGGAEAIKFQTYKAKYLASKNSPSYWDLNQESTTSQFHLFSKYDKFWKEEYEELKLECDKNDIEFMSTPFDVHSAEFLADLMPVFKISSSDITNLPFIDKLCSYGKPIILSTGAAYMWEIERAVDVIKGNGNPLSLLHCILNYPTENKHANLGMIMDLKKKYPDEVIGYSDHTLPGDMDLILYSHLLGAVIIEKHFTHDKTLPGNDHYHAMNMEDLKVFKSKIDTLYEMLGGFKKVSIPSEEPARANARRSLVLERSVKKGDVLERKHLTWKRPANGISPSEIETVIGKAVTRDVEEDEVLQYNMINYDN